MDDVKILIGKRIKELRKELSISQEKLAYRAGLDRTYVTSVENGKRNISIENIEKITNAMGIDLQYFFNSEIFQKGVHYESQQK